MSNTQTTKNKHFFTTLKYCNSTQTARNELVSDVVHRHFYVRRDWSPHDTDDRFRAHIVGGGGTCGEEEVGATFVLQVARLVLHEAECHLFNKKI